MELSMRCMKTKTIKEPDSKCLLSRWFQEKNTDGFSWIRWKKKFSSKHLSYINKLRIRENSDSIHSSVLSKGALFFLKSSIL
ncbi:unnamed protein product [Nezara viridula]|uniref:Uncharacterized protein n=1 Tax=Nezara viridula TaxID=85310 RepID=A0A9P0E6R6_NEZVI|nr:unnamed protein product [Nezara viridula]